MELRELEASDTGRVRELARSTMTASYAVSPQQLDMIVEEYFDEEPLLAASESDDRIVLVATNGDEGSENTVVGVVEGRFVDGRGEVHWLFVDPEHRGFGIGTELFEGAAEAFRERDVDTVCGCVLEASTEGPQFFERFGFERVDERRAEIGDESLVEYVYAEPDATGGTTAEDEPSATTEEDESGTSNDEITDLTDVDLPATETREGDTIATTEDGQEVYLDREDLESGTGGPFLIAYADAEHADRFGYYCSNCGSVDVVEDNVGRVECSDCGNTHAERSDEAYDESYL